MNTGSRATPGPPPSYALAVFWRNRNKMASVNYTASSSISCFVNKISSHNYGAPQDGSPYWSQRADFTLRFFFPVTVVCNLCRARACTSKPSTYACLLPSENRKPGYFRTILENDLSSVSNVTQRSPRRCAWHPHPKKNATKETILMMDKSQKYNTLIKRKSFFSCLYTRSIIKAVLS